MEINGFCHDIVTKTTKPKLAFNENVDFNEYRAQVKEKLVELLGLDVIKENACPPNMQIVEEVQKDGYTQIRFEFESEKGAVVPCYLLTPNTNKEKYPVAIVLQGHNQQGFASSVANAYCHETLDYDTGRGAFAVQAVKNGYIALAIEQRGMGERTALNTLKRRVSLNANGGCYYEATTALMLGRTIIGERCHDVSCAIDLLKNFEKCDLNNITITGNSGGGTASFYASCIDERIKVCAPSCSFCPYPESVLQFYHCSCNYIPNAYRYFDMQDLSCLIAPRKLVIVAGKYDTAFLIDGVKRGFETVKQIYEKVGAKDNCSLTITDKGHFWCEDVMWAEINKAQE
jgi:cephalosporin-C deacetylase-like acetyl esterase